MDIDAISKNCKYPERAIAFMDYMMSEHGQMLIYLGVEGVTYDIVDGKPVLKEDVSKILNSDRETYDRLYGADDYIAKPYNAQILLARIQKLLTRTYQCAFYKSLTLPLRPHE